MMSGKLSAMSAYTSGKIKIAGDLMKSQLIEKLFKDLKEEYYKNRKNDWNHILRRLYPPAEAEPYVHISGHGLVCTGHHHGRPG